MTFLFSGALLALPLALAPLLLHLLFRRRAPVIPFSTLRFVKMSVRHTAARRRVRQWVLLGCRTLLLLLLIAALAQPAWRAGAERGGPQRSMLAAVVVDTSYSMLLRQGNATLLDQADAAVRALLHGELAGARVAVFTSAADSGPLSIPRDAAGLADEWAPLRPQAAVAPLVDRVAAAAKLLAEQPADEKQLIVISDLQAREFPHPLPAVPQARTLLLDLHPARAHSAGIASVTLSPAQPLPGVGSEAVVEVVGPPGESRAVQLKLAGLDGSAIAAAAPAMVNLDGGGHGLIRFPLSLSGQRWTLLEGSLTAGDDMPWDDTRATLVEVPGRQAVEVVSDPAGATPAAERFARLALDPSEGALPAWPIGVRPAGDAAEGAAPARSIIALLSAWPSPGQAAAWRELARGGGSVVLLLRPGLEATWAQIPIVEQRTLLDLLPAAPQIGGGSSPLEPRSASVAAASDPLLQGLADQPAQWSGIVIRRMVPLASPGPAVITVLNAAPLNPTASSRLAGLLFRKPVGNGVCFTVATLPEDAFTNFATQPAFLPLMVRMALDSRRGSTAPLNAELGEPLALPAAAAGVGSAAEVQVQGPQHELYRIRVSGDGGERRFVFTQTNEPGIYTWSAVAGSGTAAGKVLAETCVQLPAAESDLTYRPAASVVASSGGAGETIIACSLDELHGKLNQQTAPRPQWSLPIAAVMFLLCVEALLGSGAIGRQKIIPTHPAAVTA